MGSNVYAFDASSGNLWTTSGGMVGSVRFDHGNLVFESALAHDTMNMATGHVTSAQGAPGDAGVDAVDESSAESPDKRLRVTRDVTNGVVDVTYGGNRVATIDIGADAYVLTDDHGKSQVFGDRTHARCNVGSAWLPLEACAPLLDRVSL